MGLDIYAGTLTRYFAKNWKTATQQFAEENGFPIEFVRKYDVLSEDELSIDEIQKCVRKWSNAVVTALSNAGSFEVWEEDNEKEYFTDKPDWCAWGAMLLFGACVIYNQPLPQTIRKDWEWDNDPIVRQALEDKDRGWSLYNMSAEWWLPIDDRFSFRFPSPNGQEICIGTTDELLFELKTINEFGWNANDETILGWSKTEGYPVDAEIRKDGFEVIKMHDEYDTESLAKFAFSILYQAALFSQKNRVPIIMDY